MYIYKCIYVGLKKHVFSYPFNHVVSSSSSNNENAATYHELICFEEIISFSSCLWCKKDLYIECVIVFHLFHAICGMITQLLFIDVVCWVKTRVFSPFMQCILLLRDWACIFLWIFVSFVSELNCWIGSWHDYGWHWGGRIRGFIRWEI